MSDAENGAMSLAESRARWLELQDELLRGITHALSNRIATVSAAAYMLEHEDMTCQQGAAQLRLETERMDTLLQLLRLLPSHDDGGAEPVAPTDVVEQAVALHAHHGELRDIEVKVLIESEVMPVLVEPNAFLQALLLAITSAKRSAVSLSGDVVLSVSHNADEVSILIHPATSAATTADFEDAAAVNTSNDAAAASWCLRSAHGRVTPRSDGGCTVTLPTLSAARRAGR